MATHTGKRARRESGLNRHQIHFASHAHKRPGKTFENNKKKFLKHDR